jgi:hypothetical protein
VDLRQQEFVASIHAVINAGRTLTEQELLITPVTLSITQWAVIYLRARIQETLYDPVPSHPTAKRRHQRADKPTAFTGPTNQMDHRGIYLSRMGGQV